MYKIFDFLDFIIIFAAGVMFSMIESAAMYSIGMPRLIIVMALAIIAIVFTAFAGYASGRRREDMSCRIAYNKGIQRGREIERAEQKTAMNKFID